MKRAEKAWRGTPGDASAPREEKRKKLRTGDEGQSAHVGCAGDVARRDAARLVERAADANVRRVRRGPACFLL